jgi:hypothetical protein
VLSGGAAVVVSDGAREVSGGAAFVVSALPAELSRAARVESGATPEESGSEANEAVPAARRMAIAATRERLGLCNVCLTAWRMNYL